MAGSIIYNYNSLTIYILYRWAVVLTIFFSLSYMFLLLYGVHSIIGACLDHGYILVRGSSYLAKIIFCGHACLSGTDISKIVSIAFSNRCVSYDFII